MYCLCSVYGVLPSKKTSDWRNPPAWRRRGSAAQMLMACGRQTEPTPALKSVCLCCRWMWLYFFLIPSDCWFTEITCAQAAAADTAGPGCGGWQSGFWVRGFEVGPWEERWCCASGSPWPHSPQCRSPPQSATPSNPPALQAGREPRPAGSSGNHAASEAASEWQDSHTDTNYRQRCQHLCVATHSSRAVWV